MTILPQVLIFMYACLIALPLAQAEQPATIRVSITSDGNQAEGISSNPAISSNGRYVAFESLASNLVSSDLNANPDIFVHDRQTGQTSRVSIASEGSEANNASLSASISDDGRHVAFASYASNLVDGDTNAFQDVFVHDRMTRQTNRVSVASNGDQAEGTSTNPAISGNGRYVAFESLASNLADSDSNANPDIFFHDRQTGQTSRVSISSEGSEANNASINAAISSNGRYVAFESLANNLVSDDTNGYKDIFVHDRQTGQTNRVSIASSGDEANGTCYKPSISDDGMYVAFVSLANNLVNDDTNSSADIFVHDRKTGQTSRISVDSGGSEANQGSYSPALSGNGFYVTFESDATNLVSNDTNGKRDIFLRDQKTGQINRISIDSDGNPTDNHSYDATISREGRYAAFDSLASNLVSSDTNEHKDVYMRGPMTSSHLSGPLLLLLLSDTDVYMRRPRISSHLSGPLLQLLLD